MQSDHISEEEGAGHFTFRCLLHDHACHCKLFTVPLGANARLRFMFVALPGLEVKEEYLNINGISWWYLGCFLKFLKHIRFMYLLEVPRRDVSNCTHSIWFYGFMEIKEKIYLNALLSKVLYRTVFLLFWWRIKFSQSLFDYNAHESL